MTVLALRFAVRVWRRCWIASPQWEYGPGPPPLPAIVKDQSSTGSYGQASDRQDDDKPDWYRGPTLVQFYGYLRRPGCGRRLRRGYGRRRWSTGSSGRGRRRHCRLFRRCWLRCGCGSWHGDRRCGGFWCGSVRRRRRGRCRWLRCRSGLVRGRRRRFWSRGGLRGGRGRRRGFGCSGGLRCRRGRRRGFRCSGWLRCRRGRCPDPQVDASADRILILVGIQEDAREVVLALHGRRRNGIGELLVSQQCELDRAAGDRDAGTGDAGLKQAETFRQGFLHLGEGAVVAGSDGYGQFSTRSHPIGGE